MMAETLVFLRFAYCFALLCSSLDRHEMLLRWIEGTRERLPVMCTLVKRKSLRLMCTRAIVGLLPRITWNFYF
jgi:hypothetical protein